MKAAKTFPAEDHRTISVKDVKIYAPLLLLLLLAVIEALEFKTIETYTPGHIALKLFWLPSIAAGSFYAYYSGVVRTKAIKKWRKIFNTFCLFFILTIVTFIGFKGVVLLWNGHFGVAKAEVIKGTVTNVILPRRKGGLATYTTVIATESNNTITLDMTNKEYHQGDHFQKELKRGSLGFLFSQQ